MDKTLLPETVRIFDSTLRDGAQGEGISFSVQDKIYIVIGNITGLYSFHF